MKQPTKSQVKNIANEWLQGVSDCLQKERFSGLNNLFMKESYWRDYLAFTWDLRTLSGIKEITKNLHLPVRKANVTPFSLSNTNPPQFTKSNKGRDIIEGGITFETRSALCNTSLQVRESPFAGKVDQAHNPPKTRPENVTDKEGKQRGGGGRHRGGGGQ